MVAILLIFFLCNLMFVSPLPAQQHRTIYQRFGISYPTEPVYITPIVIHLPIG
jgi:hypothetical protein